MQEGTGRRSADSHAEEHVEVRCKKGRRLPRSLMGSAFGLILLWALTHVNLVVSTSLGTNTLLRARLAGGSFGHCIQLGAAHLCALTERPSGDSWVEVSTPERAVIACGYRGRWMVAAIYRLRRGSGGEYLCTRML